ncbi:hypothetical protein GF339_08580 [candidate division KSB3 bacterium]|uniref:Rho termination protein n=1 Tax=candidate division KSB3 bacterium TaxID=2044937 RepID=A0A9D5JUY7_9BACT|nr:hypothetical protein [candidate division KSB3 bacterium]MBD3324625.1 hypothetical protein [candidate division KSB3 bacterium]
MDLKTLKKMPVPKLREEALKFDDLHGVHGMNKSQLIDALKEKYGITEEAREREDLHARKLNIKARIRKLKAEKAQATQDGDSEKVTNLRKRLHRERHLLKKIARKAKAQSLANA